MIHLGKTHIKKSVFLVIGPLRFYPAYTNGLVVHATLFFLSYNCLKRVLTFFFPQIFGLKQSDFREKKFFGFCLVVRGVYPPYSLSGPTTKKNTFFMYA